MKIRNFVIPALLSGLCLLRMAAQEPTWSGGVAAVVYAKCTPCHRAGEIAPFPLETFADAASHAAMIRSVTASGYMPPWPPEKGHAEYAGDRSLTDTERALIDAWVRNGAPEGNPATTPPVPVFPTGSQLGVPDLVLEMSEEWHVDGNGKDVYRYFVLPTNLLEDKSISAMEFRPGNARVVHHVLYFLDTTGTARRRDAEDPLPGYAGFGDPGFESASSFLGWVPGSQQRFFPVTIGSTLHKGSDLVIQVHYAPSSIPETDRSGVNVFFNDRPGVRTLQQFQMTPFNLPRDSSFIVLPGRTHTFLTSYKLPLDVSLLGVAPHMHLLGRTARAYAVTPDGDTIHLVRIGDWDFNWQGSYQFRHLVKVPRNSTLYYEASYDNTADNPLNPSSPPRLVTWGESTRDEMLLCYFFWLPYQPGDENLPLEPATSMDDAGSDVPQGIRVHPNPVPDIATVRFDLTTRTMVTVDVVDVLGTVHAVRHAVMEAGLHDVPMDVRDVPQGAAFVRVRTGSYMDVTPIRVQR